MNMNLPYDDLRVLTGELKKGHFNHLYQHPFNRFQESSERWWLSPSTKNISFPHGKITVSVREDWIDAEKVFVGFNVEKGICNPLVKGNAYVLQPSWFWHRFVELSSTPLEEKIAEARVAIGCPMTVVVTCAIEGQCGAPPSPGDLVMFEVNGSDLVSLKYENGDDSLSHLANARKFQDLQASLKRLNDSEYHWVDFMIGSQFTRIPESRNDLSTCAAMLRPFSSWIR